MTTAAAPLSSFSSLRTCINTRVSTKLSGLAIRIRFLRLSCSDIPCSPSPFWRFLEERSTRPDGLSRLRYAGPIPVLPFELHRLIMRMP
jgi:hypothetical protein